MRISFPALYSFGQSKFYCGSSFLKSVYALTPPLLPLGDRHLDPHPSHCLFGEQSFVLGTYSISKIKFPVFSVPVQFWTNEIFSVETHFSGFSRHPNFPPYYRQPHDTPFLLPQRVRHPPPIYRKGVTPTLYYRKGATPSLYYRKGDDTVPLYIAKGLPPPSIIAKGGTPTLYYRKGTDTSNFRDFFLGNLTDTHSILNFAFSVFSVPVQFCTN